MSGIYDRARYDLLTASLNWLTVSLKLTAWVGSPQFFPADMSIAAIKARGAVQAGESLPINSNTASIAGYAQTNPVLIPAVPVGPSVTWFTMSKVDLAVPDNSMPILHLDDVLGLPFVPNGLDMLVMPDWVYQRGWFRP
jgi:hypothetical protein